MHNATVTLEQNDNNTALISAPKLQKVRRNKQWMPVLCEHLLFRDDDDKKKAYRHSSTSSFPRSLLCGLMCVWPICECVRVCVFIAVNNKKLNGRL